MCVLFFKESKISIYALDKKGVPFFMVTSFFYLDISKF